MRFSTEVSARHHLPAPTHVILAIGVSPYEMLADKLAGLVPEIHAVGGAAQARSALEAIKEGAEIARAV